MHDGNRGRIDKNLAAGFCALAVLFTFALAYFIGSLNGGQTERRQAQPHAHAQTAKQQAERACVGTNPALVSECVYDTIEAAEETARTEQDLTAQQRAAWGAMLGSGAAFAAMIATLIGLFYVRETLLATLKAVEDTSEATDAMREANHIADRAARAMNSERFQADIRNRREATERRQGERRQLRAYVDFTTVKWTATDRPARVNHFWRGVRVSLKNFGQTPADDLEIETAFFFHREGQPLAEGPKKILTGLGGIMPTDETHQSSFMEFAEPLFHDIVTRELTLRVAITVSYVDAFGDPHMLSAVYATDGTKHPLGFIPGTRISN